MKKTIKVLIVDDCKVTTQLLRAILEDEPDIEVIACAKDGLEAVQLTRQLRPDLITMDIFMPNMSGVEATRVIMEQCPTPIIIISSQVSDAQSKIVFDALQAGALSIIQKPQRGRGESFVSMKRHILKSIRALSEVHVVARRPKIAPTPEIISFKEKQSAINILALGSSTGGPGALNCIFSSLSEDFPVPIVITQHITEGFLPGLVKWLQGSSKLIMEIAEDNQKLLPGHVYFAADDKHLTIKKGAVSPIASLDDSAPIDYLRPSVNVLFSSVAKNYPGAAIGGLLTGMGRDGAEGLLQMKKANCFTFAQSKATSTVYGMPGAAVSVQATDQIIDLEKIPQFLATLICKGS